VTREAVKRRAVLLTCGQFAGAPPLRFAANDGIRLARTFVDRCGFDDALVLADADAHRPFTRAAAIETFERIAGVATREDLLVVACSSHAETRDGRWAILARDGAIEFEAFAAYLHGIPARERVLLLDLCRTSNTRSGTDFVAKPRQLLIRRGETTTIFFACAPGERSIEDERREMGLFSFHVERVLREATESPRSEIEFERVAAVAGERVTRDAAAWFRERGHSESQTPVLEVLPRGAPALVLERRAEPARRAAREIAATMVGFGRSPEELFALSLTRGRARIYRYEHGEPRSSFDLEGGARLPARIDATGGFVCARTTTPGSAGVWSLDDGRRVRTIPGELAIARGAWGSRVLVTTAAALCVFDGASGELLRRFESADGYRGPFAFADDVLVFRSARDDGFIAESLRSAQRRHVVRWSASRNPARVLGGAVPALPVLSVEPAGDHVITFHRDEVASAVVVWDRRSARECCRWLGDAHEASPRPYRVVGANVAPERDGTSDELGPIDRAVRAHRGRIVAVSAATASTRVATAGEDACARVFELPSGALLATLRADDGSQFAPHGPATIDALATSDDGSRILIGVHDRWSLFEV